MSKKIKELRIEEYDYKRYNKVITFELDGFYFTNERHLQFQRESKWDRYYDVYPSKESFESRDEFLRKDGSISQGICSIGYGRCSINSCGDTAHNQEMLWETSVYYTDFTKHSLKEMIPSLIGIRDQLDVDELEE